MSSFGSLRNSRISGVMVTSSLPRRRSRISRDRKQPETGLEFRLERILAVAEGVVARAEEREIVCRHPLQELDRFGDLVGGKRRRIGA